MRKYVPSALNSSLTILKTITLLVLSVLLMTGCRSSKEIVTKPSKKDMELLRSLVLDKPVVYQIDSKMEFKISTREGISTSMKGSLKLKTDSCMIFSLQPFAGIEIAKCLIRSDSVFVVSRMHQIYAAESISRMPYASFGLFDIVQKILTNRVFIPGISKPEERDLNRFAWAKQKEGTNLNLTQNDYSLDYSLNDDQQYSKLRVYTSGESGNIQVIYSKFEKSDDVVFPYTIEIQANEKDKHLNLQMACLKPVFNTSSDMKFLISAKYKKVTLKELIKRFQDML